MINYTNNKLSKSTHFYFRNYRKKSEGHQTQSIEFGPTEC